MGPLNREQVYDMGFRHGLWRVESQMVSLPNKLWQSYLNGEMAGIRARLVGLEPHELAALIGEVELYLKDYASGSI